MKVALVAHRSSGYKIKDVIRNKFPSVEIIYYPYNLPNELPEMFAKLNKRSFDFYLFSGILPFMRCPEFMLPDIPYIIIKHNEDGITQALLKAKLAGYDLDHISFDIYPSSAVSTAFEEAHLSQKDIYLYKHNLDMTAQEINQSMVDFHIHNIQHKGAKLIISDFSTVTRELDKFHIPCIKLNPTRRSIEEAVYSLLLHYRENENTESRHAVVGIKLCINNKFAFSPANEHLLALRKLQLVPEIYKFAQSIQGTVIELHSLNYLIFANSKILDTEIKDYKNINLLSIPENPIFSHIAIGVGYGDHPGEAKNNAYRALSKALEKNKSSLFVVSSKITEGPYSVLDNQDDSVVNNKLLEAAHKTNISAELLKKILQVLEARNNNYFTSHELADLTGNSTRQMDRIMKKLLEAGYVKVITKQGNLGAGRPSRIFEMLLLQQ